MFIQTQSSRVLVGSCLLAAGALLAAPAGAQDRGQAKLEAGAVHVSVDYGRPSLKGRDMLSRLPEGTSWRMGMNEATVLTTSAGLSFGSTKIPAGSYSLWLERSGGDFVLVFNSQTGQWGTKHDASLDVYSVTMKSETLASPVETFTMEVTGSAKGGVLSLSWGDKKLAAPFTTAG